MESKTCTEVFFLPSNKKHAVIAVSERVFEEGNYHVFLQQGLPLSCSLPVCLIPGLHFMQMQICLSWVRLTTEGKLTLKLETCH